MNVLGKLTVETVSAKGLYSLCQGGSEGAGKGVTRNSFRNEHNENKPQTCTTQTMSILDEQEK